MDHRLTEILKRLKENAERQRDVSNGGTVTLLDDDALYLVNRFEELERLARRPTSSGGPVPLLFSPRMPRAGEILPPERRAKWARDLIV